MVSRNPNSFEKPGLKEPKRQLQLGSTLDDEELSYLCGELRPRIAFN